MPNDSCRNPNCPTHGNSPDAIALRQALQEIKTNEELMSFLRVVAANTADSIEEEAQKQGQPPNIVHSLMVQSVLMGEYDSDPILQGLIRGVAVVLRSGNEPLKTFVTKMAEVREGPHLVERLIKIAEEKLQSGRLH